MLGTLVNGSAQGRPLRYVTLPRTATLSAVRRFVAKLRTKCGRLVIRKLRTRLQSGKDPGLAQDKGGLSVCHEVANVHTSMPRRVRAAYSSAIGTLGFALRMPRPVLSFRRDSS